MDRPRAAPAIASGFGLNEEVVGCLTALTIFLAALGAQAAEQPTLVVVVGAPGAAEYQRQFDAWADRWETAARQADAKCVRLGRESPDTTSDRDRLAEVLRDEPKDIEAALWLVLIGHGTFDGRKAKFNLRGPDVTGTELAEWLQPFKRPLVVINCASSSAPFINRLSAENRVVISATKSGYELNFARFGDHLSAAMTQESADLDKDEQTSLLEAFLLASRKTQEFYEQEGRLATETALLDDNGDGLGTPADWYQGTRAVRQAKDETTVDGQLARLFHLVPNAQEAEMPPAVRRRRDALERQIAELRQSKGETTNPDEYYAKLEPLMVELARLYEELKSAGNGESKAAKPENGRGMGARE
ncbi:MAG: hypothetical protein ISR77_11280 [Pirellulaceae bacterium]|nr:hypothetical protein [Pirellulaceae bacterium]